MTIGSREVHDFCWINLLTPRAASAKSFFSKLFGWTYGEMPGVPGGHLILVQGRPAGALMDLDGSHLPAGTPPDIGVMVKVGSVDATVSKCQALGGSAEAAFDVLENGRMAMCADPNGAVFGIWQPKKEDGIQCDRNAHGAPTWFETITTDVMLAVKFYSDLFGWTPDEQDMPGMTYTLFKLGKAQIGGAMERHPTMGDVPPHWAVSFAVRNAELTVALGVDHGATVCVPVQEIPGVGRFAQLRSPEGVTFHLIEWS
jgi:uncharacterized protein